MWNWTLTWNKLYIMTDAEETVFLRYTTLGWLYFSIYQHFGVLVPFTFWTRFLSVIFTSWASLVPREWHWSTTLRDTRTIGSSSIAGGFHSSTEQSIPGRRFNGDKRRINDNDTRELSLGFLHFYGVPHVCCICVVLLYAVAQLYILVKANLWI